MTDASFLFLRKNSRVKAGSFHDNTFDGTAVRYLNLDPETLLSIDYAIYEQNLIIATSKNTLRKVLENLSETPTENVPPSSTATEDPSSTTDVILEITPEDPALLDTPIETEPAVSTPVTPGNSPLDNGDI